MKSSSVVAERGPAAPGPPFRWRSRLGVSVALFLAIGGLYVVAAIVVPITLHVFGPGSAGGLVLGDEAEGALLGRSLNDVGRSDPAMGTFLVTFMDTMCAFMMGFAVFQVGLAWSGLRRSHAWALWTALIANLAIAPYYLVIGWTFALQGAPVLIGLAGALIAPMLAAVATVVGWSGIRRTRLSGGDGGLSRSSADIPSSTRKSGGSAARMTPQELDRWFAEAKRVLEEAYLQHGDPIRQSGFGGGPDRWRAERAPIIEAIDEDGDFLDVGCANGYLLECLVTWAADRGYTIVPYGMDASEKFIELARRRTPSLSSHFYVGNAWYWTPPRRFRFVYALLDSVPDDLMGAYARRVYELFVEPGGRLIAGYYGSVSRHVPPIDAAALLRQSGLDVVGESAGGDPIITRFAWVDKG